MRIRKECGLDDVKKHRKRGKCAWQSRQIPPVPMRMLIFFPLACLLSSHSLLSTPSLCQMVTCSSHAVRVQLQHECVFFSLKGLAQISVCVCGGWGCLCVTACAWQFDRQLCISTAYDLNECIPQCCVYYLVRALNLVSALIKLGTWDAQTSDLLFYHWHTDGAPYFSSTVSA